MDCPICALPLEYPGHETKESSFLGIPIKIRTCPFVPKGEVRVVK